MEHFLVSILRKLNSTAIPHSVFPGLVFELKAAVRSLVQGKYFFIFCNHLIELDF